MYAKDLYNGYTQFKKKHQLVTEQDCIDARKCTDVKRLHAELCVVPYYHPGPKGGNRTARIEVSNTFRRSL